LKSGQYSCLKERKIGGEFLLIYEAYMSYKEKRKKKKKKKKKINLFFAPISFLGFYNSESLI